MKRVLLVFLFNICWLSAQTEFKERIIRGNEKYKESAFSEAEAEYKAALSGSRNSSKAEYNLGNALYSQERYDEAIEHFDRAAKNSTDAITRHKALHNKGNAFLEKQDYQAALDSYKNALSANPADDETRYNYSYAKQMLKKQQQEKQKQEKQNGQSGEKDQEKSENGEKTDSNQEESDSDKEKADSGKDQDSQGKNGKEEDEKQSDNGEKPDNGNQEPRAKGIPKETNFEQQLAEKKLKDLAEQEKQTHRKLIRKKSEQNYTPNDKDW